MEPPITQPSAGLWGGHLLTFPSLPSTNLWALDHADACRHGDVVRALTQTAGRGRLGRTWLSPGKEELTFSIVIWGSHCQPGTPGLLGPAAALGVRAALAEAGIRAEVKWPNDVMAGDAKIAGILIDRSLRFDLFVLGIGLNVNVSQMELNALDLRAPATSMAAQIGRPLDPTALLPRLLACLDQTLMAAINTLHDELSETWAQHDHLLDRHVRVTTADGTLAGAYGGMTATGALRLIGSDGREHILLSGDASRLDAQDDG